MTLELRLITRYEAFGRVPGLNLVGYLTTRKLLRRRYPITDIMAPAMPPCPLMEQKRGFVLGVYGSAVVALRKRYGAGVSGRGYPNLPEGMGREGGGG